MFSRVPTTSLLPSGTAFEPGSYSAHLQAKLAELAYQKQLKFRNTTTICTLRIVFFIKEIWCGSPYKWQRSLTHDGKRLEDSRDSESSQCQDLRWSAE